MSNSGTGPGVLIHASRGYKAARPSRGRIVWIIAALCVIVLAPSAASAAPANPNVNPCNGSDLLCDKTLDQVVLPGSHNSMSAAENNWALPNQSYSMVHQLERGVRAMLWDTHYAKVNMDGTVTDISKSAGRDKVPPTATYFCHEICLLGKVDLTEELGRVADWLAANPREVLVTVNQDGISPQDYASAVTNSGLLPYVYQGSVNTFPTLEQMIDSGQRVVMLAEGESAGVPWYHNAYDGIVMETPYTFDAIADPPTGGLTDPAQLDASCEQNRGPEFGAPLFLMNHWATTGVTPDIEKAKVVNTKAAIIARAKACRKVRNKLPNIVAVDYFGTGDVVGATNELNGIPDPILPPDPPAEPVLTVAKPKAVTVKAKRKATFRVKVSNVGDASATNVKVCATVPVKLARKPRCSTIASLAAGSSTVAKLGIVTKKRYRKGSASVKFMVFSNDSDQETLTSSARLTIKPLKKPRRNR